MYSNYGYNPYFTQQSNQQPVMTNYQAPMQMTKPNTLLGKSVDNIDVVRATDIPLDGSISYFPLTDGSAIVSKQLQMDGTSKIIIYKPAEEDKREKVRFTTFSDVQDAIYNFDLENIQELKEDIKELKKQLKEMKTKKSKDE